MMVAGSGTIASVLDGPPTKLPSEKLNVYWKSIELGPGTGGTRLTGIVKCRMSVDEQVQLLRGYAIGTAGP